MSQQASPHATAEKLSVRERLNLAAGVKVWHHVTFPSAQAAIDYANVAPAQQAGEFVFSIESGGSVDGAYFF